jgi:hypothetical protein
LWRRLLVERTYTVDDFSRTIPVLIDFVGCRTGPIKIGRFMCQPFKAAVGAGDGDRLLSARTTAAYDPIEPTVSKVAFRAINLGFATEFRKVLSADDRIMVATPHIIDLASNSIRSSICD